jgi:hypothetical protein
MHGIHKKAISGILCIALVLAFGKSTDISDIIIGRNAQQSISQKESYNLKSSSNKINLLNQSETKAGSNTADDNDDWLDENGELKNTVIVDKEKDYYKNDNRIIIEYRNNVKEPAAGVSVGTLVALKLFTGSAVSCGVSVSLTSGSVVAEICRCKRSDDM